MPIPQDHEQEILHSGMSFMRAITEAYGSDEGMKLWDTIASTLDPDIKGKIFVALLVGEFGDRLTLRLNQSRYMGGKVEGIKALRQATGMGLKEAKDMHDELCMGKVQEIKIEPTLRRKIIRDLASVYIDAH